MKIKLILILSFIVFWCNSFSQDSLAYAMPFEISKKGNVINKGDLRGDVKVRIEIEEHESYKRNGLDIIYTKKLSLKESLCGFSFELNHLKSRRETLYKFQA